MHTLAALIELVLGFVPFIGIALAITAALWFITLMFPEIGVWFERTMDRLFGVDAEYDATYDTGYASTTSHDQYI